MLPLLLVMGCAANIHQLYQQARSQALARPPPASRDWRPDAVAWLSPAQVSELLDAASVPVLSRGAPIDVDVGPVRATLRPEARMERLEVSPGAGCGSCLSLDASVRGQVAWKLAGVSGRLPFDADLAGQVELTVAPAAGGSSVTARVTRLDRVRVSLGRGRAPELPLRDRLGAWLREAIVRRLPPVPLGDIGGQDLPLREFRLSFAGAGLRVEALTDAPGGRPVTASPDHPDRGWSAAVSSATLLSLARRAAFQADALPYDVHLDPRSLRLQDGRFVLDLRVWRLSGRGWWRDYRVTGRLEAGGRRLRMEARGVQEIAHSRGAGLADPLALLAQARILEAIADGATQTFPASGRARAGGASVRARVSSVSGRQGALVASGVLDVAGKAAGSRRRHP